MVTRRDVVYLDLALENTIRSIIEANLANVRQAAQLTEGLPQVASSVAVALEAACLSFGSNQELLLTLKSLKVRPCLLRKGAASNIRFADTWPILPEKMRIACMLPPAQLDAELEWQVAAHWSRQNGVMRWSKAWPATRVLSPAVGQKRGHWSPSGWAIHP